MIPVVTAVLADLLGGAGAGIAGGLSIGGLARLYESAPVRNLLLKMGKTKRNKTEEAALFKRLLATISQQKKKSDTKGGT